MDDFLHRHVIAVWVTAVVAVVAAVVFGVFFYTQTEINRQTLQRYDRIAPDGALLPGPQSQLSKRSELQLDVLLKSNPHILGGYVGKLSFAKTDDPFIYVVANDPVLTAALAAFVERQKSGKGVSSADLAVDPSQKIRNSEESRNGLIKCGPVEDTTLDDVYPQVLIKGKGICRATIPPFDPNNNLAISVLVDIPTESNSVQIQAIRRILLQLQIDIYNRDYQGRETWAHF